MPIHELEKLLDLLLSGGTHSPRSKTLARELTRRAVPEAIPEREAFQAFFTRMEEAPGLFLAETRGMTDAASTKIRAALSLAEKYLLYRGRARRAEWAEIDPPVSRPRMMELAMARVSEELRELPYEWLGFIPLYRDGTLGHLCVIERGGRAQVRFDPGEFFSRVLALRPAGIYLIHHHPSGDLRPSRSDLELTRQVAELCTFFGTSLLDHGIVSPLGETWLSEVESAHGSVLPEMRKTRTPLRLQPDSAAQKPGSGTGPSASAGTG